MLSRCATVYLLLLYGQEARAYFASPRIPKPNDAAGIVEERLVASEMTESR